MSAVGTFLAKLQLNVLDKETLSEEELNMVSSYVGKDPSVMYSICMKADEKVVGALLDRFPSLAGLALPGKNTTLHAACANRKFGAEVARRILAIRGDLVHSVNSQGDSVYHIAFRNPEGHRIVSVLKDVMGVRNKLGMDGNGLVHLMASNPNPSPFIPLVSEMISSGLLHKDHLTIKNSEGYTPLHLACRNLNGLQAVKYLCTAADGHTLRVKDEMRKYTALHLACENRKQGSLMLSNLLGSGGLGNERLLERGKNNVSCFHIACLNQGEVNELLPIMMGSLPPEDLRTAFSTSDSEGNTALHHLASNPRAAVLGQVLDRLGGLVDLDLRDRHGRNLLHLGVHSPQNIRLLVDRSKGKLLSAKTYEGQTPLHLACQNAFLEGVLALLDCSATNLAALNKNGWSPLCELIEVFAQLEVERLDLAKGILDSDLREKASVRGKIEKLEGKQRMIEEVVLRYCNDPAFDPNIALGRSRRYDYLHILASSGFRNREVLSLVAGRSRDPNILDAHGESPLHLALREENRGMVLALLSVEGYLAIEDAESLVLFIVTQCSDIGLEKGSVVKRILYEHREVERRRFLEIMETVSPLGRAIRCGNSTAVYYLLVNPFIAKFVRPEVISRALLDLHADPGLSSERKVEVAKICMACSHRLDFGQFLPEDDGDDPAGDLIEEYRRDPDAQRQRCFSEIHPAMYALAMAGNASSSAQEQRVECIRAEGIDSLDPSVQKAAFEVLWARARHAISLSHGTTH